MGDHGASTTYMELEYRMIMELVVQMELGIPVDG